MFLTILLEKAINDLDILQEYYEIQIDYIQKRVEEENQKYKYSIALEKFFFFNVIEEKGFNFPDKLEITDEEKKMVDQILEKYEFMDGEDGIAISYKLKDTAKMLENQYELSPNKGLREYNKLQEQPRILGKTTLMMLIINYEEVIAGIFKQLISKYPNAYLTSKTMTYAEIMALDVSIKDIKKFFIDNEVETIMRMPLSDWYKIFETKHNAKFNFGKGIFEEFKEIYYRRNILVHNNGIVNRIYMDNVSEQFRDEIELGDDLDITLDYIKRAIDVTQMILYETFWSLRKVSDNREYLEQKLFDIGFEHMLQQKWHLSEFIYNNLKDEKEQNISSKTCNLINYWISLKNEGKFELIKKEIETFDVSAMDGQFKVAKYALLDDYEKVSYYLEQIIEKDMSPNTVETWPLFIQYRLSGQYKEFKKLHADLFEIKQYNPEEIELEEAKEVEI